jgi:hypothetical protein
MILVKKSNITGNLNQMEIPVQPDKYEEWLQSKKKPHIQDFFPELSDEEREFILNGITPEEWNEYIGDEEE